MNVLTKEENIAKVWQVLSQRGDEYQDGFFSTGSALTHRRILYSVFALWK